MADEIRTATQELKEMLQALRAVYDSADEKIGRPLIEPLMKQIGGIEGLSKFEQNSAFLPTLKDMVQEFTALNNQVNQYIANLRTAADEARQLTAVSAVPESSATSAPTRRVRQRKSRVPSESVIQLPIDQETDSDFVFVAAESLPRRRSIAKRPRFADAKTSGGSRVDIDQRINQIIEFVENNLKNVDFEQYTPEVVESIKRLQQGIRAIRDGAGGRQFKRDVLVEFRKLFPATSLEKEDRSILQSTARDAIKHLGLNREPAAKALSTATDEYLLDVVERLLDQIGVIEKETGRVQITSLDKNRVRKELTRKGSQALRRLRGIVDRAITARVVLPSEVSYADTSGMRDVTPASTGRPDDSDDSPENELAGYLGGQIFRSVGSATGKGTVYASKRRFSNKEARDSLRQSIRGGTYREGGDYDLELAQGAMVTGYDAGAVFPTQSAETIKQRMRTQREQINQEIKNGQFVSITINGKQYKVPKSLAQRRVAAVRAASAMSRDTTLVGRRATTEKTGPAGIYGAGAIEESTLDLHAGAMLARYLENPEQMIASDLDSTFMSEVVEQTELDPDAVTQNPLRMYAERALESLDAQMLSARKRAAAATNPKGRAIQEKTINKLFQQRKMLQEIMVNPAEVQAARLKAQLASARTPEEIDKIKGDIAVNDVYVSEEGKERARLLGIEGQSLSSEKALGYIFGPDIAAAATFEDASLGIRSYASGILDRLVSRGVAVPSRGYRPRAAYKKETSFDVMSEGPENIMEALGLGELFGTLSIARGLVTPEGRLKSRDKLIADYPYNPRDPDNTAQTALSGLFTGAEDIRDVGASLLEFARMPEGESKEQIRADNELLAALDYEELDALTAIDSNQSPQKMLQQIMRIIGKKLLTLAREFTEVKKAQIAIQRQVTKNDSSMTEARRALKLELLDDDEIEADQLPTKYEAMINSVISGDPDTNAAFTLIDNVIKAQDSGYSEEQFLAAAMGNQPVRIIESAKDTSPAATRNAVLEMGRQTALTEAGRTTNVSAQRRLIQYGEETDSQSQYAAGLMLRAQSTDKEVREKALRDIALHRLVASSRGQNPDNWMQHGFVSQSEGFEGDPARRAEQYVNYEQLERKVKPLRSGALPSGYSDEIAAEFARIKAERERVRERQASQVEVDFQYNPVLGEGSFSPISSRQRQLLQGTVYAGQVKTAMQDDPTGEPSYESAANFDDLTSAVANAKSAKELLGPDANINDPETRAAVLKNNPELIKQIIAVNRQLNMLAEETPYGNIFPTTRAYEGAAEDEEFVDQIALDLIARRDQTEYESVIGTAKPALASFMTFELQAMIDAQKQKMARGARYRLDASKPATLSYKEQREREQKRRQLTARSIDLQKSGKSLSKKEQAELNQIRREMGRAIALEMAASGRYSTSEGQGVPQLLDIALGMLSSEDDQVNAAGYRLIAGGTNTKGLIHLSDAQQQQLHRTDFSDYTQRSELMGYASPEIQGVLKSIRFDEKYATDVLSYNPVVGPVEESTVRKGRKDRQIGTSMRQRARDAESAGYAYARPEISVISQTLKISDDIQKEKEKKDAERAARAADKDEQDKKRAETGARLIAEQAAKRAAKTSEEATEPVSTPTGAVVKNLKGVAAVQAAERAVLSKDEEQLLFEEVPENEILANKARRKRYADQERKAIKAQNRKKARTEARRFRRAQRAFERPLFSEDSSDSTSVKTTPLSSTSVKTTPLSPKSVKTTPLSFADEEQLLFEEVPENEILANKARRKRYADQERKAIKAQNRKKARTEARRFRRAQRAFERPLFSEDSSDSTSVKTTPLSSTSVKTTPLSPKSVKTTPLSPKSVKTTPLRPTGGKITTPLSSVTAPGATINATGGTVTITGATFAGGNNSAVVVASGGGGVTGGGGGITGGGITGRGRMRTATGNITEMIFAQMDLLNDVTKDALKAAPDEAAQQAIRQANKQTYLKLEKKALETQLEYGSPRYERVPAISDIVTNLDISADPQAELDSLSEVVLQLQKDLLDQKQAIKDDPTISDDDRTEQLAAVSDSERQLNAFANVVKKITEDLNRFQQSIKPPYRPEASAAGGGGGAGGVRTRSGRLMTEQELLAQSELESRRNLYSTFQGDLSHLGSRFESQMDLTRTTRRYAKTVLGQLPSVDLTNVNFMGNVAQETQANQALADLQARIQEIDPNAIETRPIEQLAVELSQVISAAINLNEVIQGASQIDDTQSAIQNLVTATGYVETQQKKTSEELDKASAINARNFEENMQALVSQPGVLRRMFGGVQREAARHTREYLTGIFGDSPEGRRAIEAMFYRDQMVAYDDRGRRRNIVGASTAELRNLQTRVRTESGMNVSLDELQRMQRAMAKTQQARNQSPFNDTFFYAMSRIRDLQTLGQTAMAALNLPQTIASTIQQVGDPQLRTERIMTTARSLSLSPETYTKALAAATKQQSMFGGTLARNLEDMTSFIPISNTYGVDVSKSVQVARKLAAFDPAQGMQGASIALKEFLSGNVSSLSRRFEINRSELSKINTGDANEMLDNLDTLLAKMGVTDKLIDDQANSLATKYDRMTGRLETLQVAASAMAINAMTPLLEPILGDQSFLARQSLDQNLQRVVTERLKSYGDSVLSNPETGLRSVDIFASDFAEKLDPLLAQANASTSAAALDFTATTGNISNVELYRRMGAMKPAERRRIQQSAQISVLMGMNQDQAILKAMRDVGGDFFGAEEYQAQRRPLGYYGPAFNDTLRNDMIKQSERQMRFGQQGQRVQILEQIDADTYDVRMPNGRRQRVRLAGVDAPEKTTEAGRQATAYTRNLFRGDPNDPKNVRYATLYSSGNYDQYQRLLASMSFGGRDIATALVASGNAAVYNYGGRYNPELIAPLSALERNAANTGMGAINAEAARLGLGANAEISQEARDTYFRNTYFPRIGGAAGVSAGVFGGLAGLINTLSTIGAAGTFLTTGVAATGGAAALPVIPIALGAAALGGGIYTGYAAYQDMNDSSSAKYRELYRIQSEIDQRTKAEQFANVLYPISEQEDRAANRIANTAPYSAERLAALIFNEQNVPETDQARAESREEFTNQYIQTGRELSKYYNGLSQEQKSVYSLIVDDPITKRRQSVFETMQTYQTLVLRDITGTDETAKKLLDEYKGSYDDFASRINDSMRAAKVIDIAQEYGIVSTFTGRPRGAPPSLSQSVTRPITLQEFNDLDAAQRARVEQNLNEQINTASWTRFAKEYADQAMEKQYQLSQQRFSQFVDLNAMNSFAGLNSIAVQRNPLVGSTKLGRANESATDAALRTMSQTIFVEGVKYNKSNQENLRNAQEQAVKSLESQVTMYKEQADLTRPFNLALKGTYSNFIQTLRNAGAQYSDIIALVSQGNPRGFLDLSQQMSGFNLQAIMQNRITTQNQGVMGITGPTTFGASGPLPVGPSFNYGYTQGPRGTIKYAQDFMKAPELPLFNPATIFSTIMQGVQANTEIVQRNIQFGRQMRDADINNRRSIEDINRNGMRNLEDIHRNYTRNMLQLAQQSETTKRLGTAQFYTNAVAANISPEEKARITALREQGQQKASHVEQADVGGYLKTPEGMQDTELQAAYAEYEAVPWTDYNTKEAAWRKVTDLVEARKTAAESRMNSATTVEEREPAQRMLGLLSKNYDRGQQYRKYVDDQYTQQLEFAAKRKQLTTNRTDLEREGARLRDRAPDLQKQLAEAKTPEEIKAANQAIEDNNVSIQKNSEALEQNARELDAVTITAPLWADNWREAGKNILESSSSTISGLINNLDDFNITYARQLEDAYRGFKNAKEDMVRQFTEAATEISAAVPAEFAKALTAITAYQRLTLKAEAYYNAGKIESAQSIQKLADVQLVSALYPKGSDDYNEMLTNLSSRRNEMTADGMKKDDLTMGPSGLGAYGELMSDGKYYLRVKSYAQNGPTTTTQTGGGGGTGDDSFDTQIPGNSQ